MAKNRDYVSVPREEYEELIECRMRINDVYKFITDKHKSCIAKTGMKRQFIYMNEIESASGYTENENYFKKLQKDFEERRTKNENDFKIAPY
jgi:hypothetical protein